MRYRVLFENSTGVSEVGFGVWTVGTTWWGIKNPKDGINLLRLAAEKGINFFDTAPIYGNGRGEEILADAFWNNGVPREQMIISTKFGYDINTIQGDWSGDTEVPQDFSCGFIIKSCEESLKRLNTDYIDLFQMHNPRNSAIVNDEVYEALDILKEQGKIHLGGAVLGPDTGWIEEGKNLAGKPQIAVEQVIYNILEQEPSYQLISGEYDAPTSFIVRLPHASGILDKRETPKNLLDYRHHRSGQWLESAGKAVNALSFLEDDLLMSQAAIQFCLSQKGVKSVLPNFIEPGQINEFCVSSDLPPLKEEIIQTIQEVWIKDIYPALNHPLSDSQSTPSPTVLKGSLS